MRVEDIKLYYGYNEWANNRILDAAQQASPEQLTAPNALGWGDLRGMLTHTLNAESGWFNFLFEGGGGEWLKAEDVPDVSALRARWGRQNEITRQCLDSLEDADLTRRHARERGGQRFETVLWQALVHVVNHGTQHRSECAALLTGLGSSPGDMDLTLYLNDAGIASGPSDSARRADIELLFRYNDWANERILATAERVSAEEFTLPNDFGWGSLQGALVHLMDAEYAWRVLLKDGEHVEWLQPEDFADVAAIRRRWAQEREAFWRYLEGLSSADLSATISYEGDSIRYRALWHCLAHVVNHGTQHRAECAALLTGFGHSPGNLGFHGLPVGELMAGLRGPIRRQFPAYAAAVSRADRQDSRLLHHAA